MKMLKSLPARLLIAIVIGLLAGLVLPEKIMVLIVTVKYILNQLISFCVPLIIIGFIAPSITKLVGARREYLPSRSGLPICPICSRRCFQPSWAMSLSRI